MFSRFTLMNEEIFDVVDEQDRVVQQEKRSVVHAQGLLHRAVHVLVFNQRNELFLQKRSMTKDVAPGCWDSSCCGHVHAGETYDEAAIRELQEELGLRLNKNIITFLFKIAACEETGYEFAQVYRLEHEGPFELHPEEIETGEWFTIDQVDRLVDKQPTTFAPSFLCIWKRVRS